MNELLAAIAERLLMGIMFAYATYASILISGQLMINPGMGFDDVSVALRVIAILLGLIIGSVVFLSSLDTIELERD